MLGMINQVARNKAGLKRLEEKIFSNLTRNLNFGSKHSFVSK